LVLAVEGINIALIPISKKIWLFIDVEKELRAVEIKYGLKTFFNYLCRPRDEKGKVF